MSNIKYETIKDLVNRGMDHLDLFLSSFSIVSNFFIKVFYIQFLY